MKEVASAEKSKSSMTICKVIEALIAKIFGDFALLQLEDESRMKCCSL